MKRRKILRAFGYLLAMTLATSACAESGATGALPVPAVDVLRGASGDRQTQTAVFAGGCFWGVEAVYRHVKGVTRAVSGYAGGDRRGANYAAVGSGTTGHAESVEVTFDPAVVSYGQLLRVFFSVAHDPTELNRQGPDVGTQYRSAIFYSTADQKRVAQAYVEQLNQAKAFARPIVTEIAALPEFFPAESYHQNYLALHPEQPYIVINDLPKLTQLRAQFPQIYRAK